MNTLTIVNQEVQIKEWEGQRVVTFKDIDQVHQRPEGTAKRNFYKNKDHFIEGEDYHKVFGYEFRTQFGGDTEPQRGNPNIEVILLTESGYLMLVKSFTDNTAWQVQRALVNSYFRVKTVTTPKRTRAKPVDMIFRQRLNMARDFSKVTGIPLGIAVAKAIDDAEKLTGEDYTLWKHALPARTDEKPVPHLNVTQLGATIGLSAHDTNMRLEAAGLQSKVDKCWRLTEAGKLHGEEYPFVRNGHSDYSIRWRESVAGAVKELLPSGT